MTTYTTLDDVIRLFRELKPDEEERAEALIPTVEAKIRQEADAMGKDLDDMAQDDTFRLVLKSVVVDVVARTLMTSTDQEPMTQTSESALGYSWSGTYLVPGGGIFIKRGELASLGLRKQRYGVIDFYDKDPWDPNYPY